MDNLNVKNIVGRFKSETPVFFQKVRTLMVSIGVAGGTLKAITIPMPEIVTTIAGYMIAMGAVGAALSQLTCNQPEEKQ